MSEVDLPVVLIEGLVESNKTLLKLKEAAKTRSDVTLTHNEYFSLVVEISVMRCQERANYELRKMALDKHSESMELLNSFCRYLKSIQTTTPESRQQPDATSP